MKDNRQERNAAIILAAGTGSRMCSDVPKQYMLLAGKPVLWYSLEVFEQFEEIDDIVLVTAEADIPYCRDNIVRPGGFTKVRGITVGGKERYDSVKRGLAMLDDRYTYVMIHDGARPLADAALLQRSMDCVRRCGACVAGMPVKDTIKQCGPQGEVLATPARSGLWIVQTPQTFSFPLIRQCYAQMKDGAAEGITDDAMLVEKYGNHTVVMAEGSYYNIKITTPEDLKVAEALLEHMGRFSR